ncbi:MAG: ATP-dependent helicase [Bacillaceae bacterium]|nr:ATP-dependent helicase [Bacillaceae bacterium]
MKLANFNERLIHIEQLERSELQRIFLEAQRGNIVCPCCRQAVKLQLGIMSPPTFTHPSQTYNCEETIAVLEKKEEKRKVQVGSFTLPTSRSINDSSTATMTKTTIDCWKDPIEINNFQRFNQTEKKLANPIYNLDEHQWKAVSYTEGPLLVLAGAGSGKTRVLTSRTAYMLTEKKIPANRILLVTFTAKAAQEMKQRMKQFNTIQTNDLNSLVVGTFHSVFYKMLAFHEPQKWESSKLLKWDWKKEQMIREAARERDIDEKDFPFDQAITQISYWKNQLLLPESIRPKDHWEENVQFLYKKYEEGKEKQLLFDFDDMLVGCYKLLTENTELLRKYQDRFSYILVDEFQDINKVQYEIVKLLAEKTNNLCVVGDDDQSIYSFRGSDPSYILNFESDFPRSKVVTLSNNYRSNHEVVCCAKQVISHNKKRKMKLVHALYERKKGPIQFFPYDEEEEATMIVNDIKEKIQTGANPSDFAILFRTSTASRAIFERLVDSNLPFYLEQDGEGFYTRKTVRKALAYLKLALNPDDQEAMKELLTALFLKQSVLQDLKAMSILNDCSMLKAMTKLTNIQPFQLKKIKKMMPHFAKIKTLPTTVALEWVEKEMGLIEYVKKNGNEGNAIEKGSDDLRDLKVAANAHPNIVGFLEHVDHMVAKTNELKSQRENNESIKLMTVHRAKGLEFSTVYVLSAVEGSFPHDYALESFREGDTAPLEEERRLMYVAITRAMNELYLSIPQKRRGKKANISRFMREIKIQA